MARKIAEEASVNILDVTLVGNTSGGQSSMTLWQEWLWMATLEGDQDW